MQIEISEQVTRLEAALQDALANECNPQYGHVDSDWNEDTYNGTNYGDSNRRDDDAPSKSSAITTTLQV